MEGKWYTTGGGGGGVLGALVVGAVVLVGGGVAAGIAEGVKESVHELLIILAGLVAIVAGVVWLVIYLIRHASPAVTLSPGGRQELERQGAALRESQRRAITAPQQVTVNHFYGGQHWHAPAPGDPIRQAIPGQAEDAAREEA